MVRWVFTVSVCQDGSGWAPFDERSGLEQYDAAAQASCGTYRTFCGTTPPAPAAPRVRPDAGFPGSSAGQARVTSVCSETRRTSQPTFESCASCHRRPSPPSAGRAWPRPVAHWPTAGPWTARGAAPIGPDRPLRARRTCRAPGHRDRAARVGDRDAVLVALKRRQSRPRDLALNHDLRRVGRAGKRQQRPVPLDLLTGGMSISVVT